MEVNMNMFVPIHMKIFGSRITIKLLNAATEDENVRNNYSEVVLVEELESALFECYMKKYPAVHHGEVLDVLEAELERYLKALQEANAADPAEITEGETFEEYARRQENE